MPHEPQNSVGNHPRDRPDRRDWIQHQRLGQAPKREQDRRKDGQEEGAPGADVHDGQDPQGQHKLTRVHACHLDGWYRDGVCHGQRQQGHGFQWHR